MKISRQILDYHPNKHASLMNLMNECDALVHYSIKYEKNLGRKIEYVLALILCATAFLFTRLFVQPFEGLYYERRKIQLLRQIKTDKDLLKGEASRVGALVDSIVKKESLFDKLPAKERELAKDVAMATYAITTTNLAPILLDWTKSLLIRAKEKNLRLVFMARDGLGPYEMAKVLQKENPEFASVPLQYVYLSRNVVKNDPKKLSQYLFQEGIAPVALKDGQRFLFVDIGFLGSMIPRIRKALAEIGIPSDPKRSDNRIDFEFCISTGEEAHGFVGNLKSVLPSVQSAGQNRGVYWIEDTHQGWIDSPKKLVNVNGGVLVPDSVEEQGTCKDKNELDYLCKIMALEALKRVAKDDAAIKKDTTRNYELVSGSLRQLLDTFLRALKERRYLYVDHR